MRFTERRSTVVGTCRINDINPFHFLVDMIGASFSDKHTVPDLLSYLQN